MKIFGWMLVVAAALAGVGRAQVGAAAGVARPRITGISHVAYYVSDLPRAERFWRDFLGYAEPYSLAKPGTSETRIAFIQINERQHVELFNEAPVIAGQMMAHLAFRVDDIAVMRAYLIAQGVTVPGSDGAKTRAGDRAFTIVDPNGMRIEFVQVLPDGMEATAAAKPLPATRIGSRIYHAGYMVGDAAKTIAFYRMLGFTETWRGGADPKELSWINMRVPDGEDYVELMLYQTLMEPEKWGGKNHLSLLVKDANEAVAVLKTRAEKAGYAKPLEVRVGVNGKRQVNMYDGDGTRVEIMEGVTADGKVRPPSTAPPPAPAITPASAAKR